MRTVGGDSGGSAVSGFEEMLRDPYEQFDRRGEILKSVVEYANAEPAAVGNPLAELSAIARERYETGAYGDCHLRVASDVLDLMRELTPREPDWRGGAVGSLMAIPIVVDDALPAGVWRLVRCSYDGSPPYTRRDEVVQEGTVRR